MRTPSFLTSTLALAFMLCVLSTIVMIFMGITPDDKLFTVISGIIAAYLGARTPNAPEEVKKTSLKE